MQKSTEIYVLCSLLLIITTTFFLGSTVYSYEIKTGLSSDCHEKLTKNAFEAFLNKKSIPAIKTIVIPEDNRAEKYVNEFFGDLLKSFKTEKERFFASSLLMGVRWPDEHGRSVTSTEALYANHGDASDQFEHCLRSKNDDYDNGNFNALKRTQNFFKDRLIFAASYIFKLPQNKNIKIIEYVEFYGQVEFEVYAPAFYLGTALHTLQDSFSHTVRTDDLHSILSVLNFVDAISGSFDEQRDGIAHSYHMDTCDWDGDNAEIITAVTDATEETFGIFLSQSKSDAEKKVNEIIKNWMLFKPGCGYSNNYCDSKWLPIIREDPTTPVFGCTVTVLGFKTLTLWKFLLENCL